MGEGDIYMRSRSRAAAVSAVSAAGAFGADLTRGRRGRLCGGTRPIGGGRIIITEKLHRLCN